MKKSSVILISLNFIGFISLLIPSFVPDDAFDGSFTLDSLLTLAVVLYLALFIIGIYFRLEEKGLNMKELSFIAIYGTFTAVARIPFTGMPSIQPCSYLIICAGVVFGPLIGFIIGGNVAIISNIFLGQGPWTIFQIFAWGAMGASSGIFYRIGQKREQDYHPKKIFLVIFGSIWGLLFGWIMNSWYWLEYVQPHTLVSFFTAMLSSIHFDLLHAIGNAIFLAIFSYPTLNILNRYRQRFTKNIIQTKNRGKNIEKSIIEHEYSDVVEKTR